MELIPAANIHNLILSVTTQTTGDGRNLTLTDG